MYIFINTNNYPICGMIIWLFRSDLIDSPERAVVLLTVPILISVDVDMT
jgi:hypothetical protein